jgi:NAD(P)H-flavin reductase|tara:strand:- start:1958 stop:2146 length:189 start_codon:yes stop_codon:yes gene_type:complete
MRLAKDQGQNVKVTFAGHPFVAVKEGGVKSKSFVVYDCTPDEMLEFVMTALKAHGACDEDDE